MFWNGVFPFQPNKKGEMEMNYIFHKFLYCFLCLFISMAFTNIGKDIHVYHDSYGVDDLIVIELENKDNTDNTENTAKMLENIRYSFYRGYREWTVQKGKVSKICAIIKLNEKSFSQKNV